LLVVPSGSNRALKQKITNLIEDRWRVKDKDLICVLLWIGELCKGGKEKRENGENLLSFNRRNELRVGPKLCK